MLLFGKTHYRLVASLFRDAATVASSPVALAAIADLRDRFADTFAEDSPNSFNRAAFIAVCEPGANVGKRVATR